MDNRLDPAGYTVLKVLSPRHPGPRPAVDRLQALRSTSHSAGVPDVAPYLANRTETWGEEQGDSLEAIGDGWAVYRRSPPVLDWLASSSRPRFKLFTPLSVGMAMLCLLLFNGAMVYCRCIFHFHRLEDPHYDLLIVKKDDNSELAFFRKKTTPDIIDPARAQLNALVKMRKESKKGTVYPDRYAERTKKIGDRLVEIMDTAKLRQIPKQYAKNYEAEVLVGVAEIYRSWLAFQDALEATNPQDEESGSSKSP